MFWNSDCYSAGSAHWFWFLYKSLKVVAKSYNHKFLPCFCFKSLILSTLQKGFFSLQMGMWKHRESDTSKAIQTSSLWTQGPWCNIDRGAPCLSLKVSLSCSGMHHPAWCILLQNIEVPEPWHTLSWSQSEPGGITSMLVNLYSLPKNPCPLPHEDIWWCVQKFCSYPNISYNWGTKKGCEGESQE